MATVTNQTEFKAAVTDLETDIIVANTISLTSPTTIGHTVSISGAAGVSLLWAGPSVANPNMLIISASGDVTIESLILDAEGRNGRLVYVNGGKFTMNNDTILRNITSTTSFNAVRVGDASSPAGSTFIMNGGLITGINSSDAVYSAGGTIEMHGDAAIDNNLSAGVTMSAQGTIRPKLTMTGNSRISNNESSQGASAGILLSADIVMGVNEGDAPKVTGNHTPDGFAIGAWLLGDCTLTMRYNAEVSENSADTYGGGISTYNATTIFMYDNAVIRNNTTNGFGGGLLLGTNSALTMDGQSQIMDNACGSSGGGVNLQSGSSLEMKGNASIHGNTATNGAGIFLNPPSTTYPTPSSVTIGSDNSTPSIYENIASGRGGGICITNGTIANVTGQTVIDNNRATEGTGIYKLGTLNLSGSPQILDGLFFNDQNVPIIVDALTQQSSIHLEASDYVAPPNVPLVIANKGTSYTELSETDRAAWHPPAPFTLEYIVILNDDKTQVLIVRQTSYALTYYNLFGAQNSNPTFYVETDLPITLVDPGARSGYRFIGWYNIYGQRATTIPAGTTGQIIFTAVWQRL